MLYYPAPFDQAEIDRWIRRNRARYFDPGFGLWAMLLKHSGELIGDCGCFIRELEGSVEFELGWHVRRDMWGRGYATEAARHCAEYAFSRLAQSGSSRLYGRRTKAPAAWRKRLV
jgi:[ribosomal protein S5]-alanine N-acetyltransferase